MTAKKHDLILKDMQGIYDRKSIAILGPGPSAALYKGKEDVTIAVNGGVQLLGDEGYFLSMYKAIQFRSFFRKVSSKIIHILRPHSAIYSKVFYNKSDRQHFIQINNEYMEQHPEQTQLFNGNRFVSKEYEFMPHFLDELPGHHLHLLVRRVQDNIKISRDQSMLTQQGSSSSTAIQLAFIMGAEQIHLYGVGFTYNEASSDKEKSQYFYTPPASESGGPSLIKYKKDIDKIILAIMSENCMVFSHGYSTLDYTIKIND